MWLTIVAVGNNGGALGREETKSAVVKGKRTVRTGARKYTSLKSKPESLSAYTILLEGKYTPAPILLLDDLMSSMEISMDNADMIMKPEQYFDIFPALAMACGLLADVSTNDIISPIDKALVDKTIGFLAEQLIAIQLLALGDEGQVVSILADAILCGPRRPHKRTAWTMLFNIAKSMARGVPLTKFVLLDSDPYFTALLVATLYKAGNAIRVPQKGNVV